MPKIDRKHSVIDVPPSRRLKAATGRDHGILIFFREIFGDLEINVSDVGIGVEIDHPPPIALINVGLQDRKSVKRCVPRLGATLNSNETFICVPLPSTNFSNGRGRHTDKFGIDDAICGLDESYKHEISLYLDASLVHRTLRLCRPKRQRMAPAPLDSSRARAALMKIALKKHAGTRLINKPVNMKNRSLERNVSKRSGCKIVRSLD